MKFSNTGTRSLVKSQTHTKSFKGKGELCNPKFHLPSSEEECFLLRLRSKHQGYVLSVIKTAVTDPTNRVG